MKKIHIILLALLVPAFLNAQSFNEGNLLIKGGLGFSSPYYLTNSEGTLPPLSLSLDYAVKDKIGIGGILGITSSRYTIGDPSSNGYIAKQSYRLIGGRATYHFWSKEHFDLYLGAMMGYIFTGWNVTYKSNYYAKNEIAKPRYGGVVLAGFAGLNYSVNNDWGVFGEVGYSLSYVTGGAYWRISSIK